MRTRPGGFLCIAALASLLAACVVSGEPVVDAADATFDPDLLGTWAEVGGTDTALVRRAASGGYAIEYSSDGHAGRFEARLGRIGGRKVLDLWPAPRTGELPEPYTNLLLAAHLAVFLDVRGDEARIVLLAPDSMRTEVRAHPERWPRAVSGDRVVLGGSTAELRAALASYVARPGTLGTPTVFRRVGAPVR